MVEEKWRETWRESESGNKEVINEKEVAVLLVWCALSMQKCFCIVCCEVLWRYVLVISAERNGNASLK